MIFLQDFLSMAHQREGQRLDAWLARVAESGLPELQSFASGVEKDKDAVQAGLTWPINNGMVEGRVTKLKLIGRNLPNTHLWRRHFHVMRLHCSFPLHALPEAMLHLALVWL
jgi:hypothetical protein